jgi:hypothetical protein
LKKETGFDKWLRRLEAYGYDLDDDGKYHKQKNGKREKDLKEKKVDRRR